MHFYPELLMRSYYEHLETAMGKKTLTSLQKPVFRASSIFPVINAPGISSRIIFMGYWLVKRNIKEIAALLTLRSMDGTILSRSQFAIQEPKCYRIELKNELEAAGLSPEEDFTGSLEIEFFSTVNLVFPFPATVINYYGPKFSSVVHTAQRIYNDYDDMRNNSQTAVPESGFNIYADENIEPYIGVINGNAPVLDSIFEMEFYNTENETFKSNLNLGTLAPYQTTMLYPARILDLKSFLKGKAGAGKLKFKVNGVFPRLIVGNLDHSLPAMTITHTYYDCSEAATQKDYWMPVDPKWYPASLMAPAYTKSGEFTNIYFYPIYSPSKFTIDIEFHDRAGHLAGRKNNFLIIEAPQKNLIQLEINKVARELGISTSDNLAIRLSARPVGNFKLPARIKIGLDIGQRLFHMPCNICTNLQPYIPSWETKPSTFRWSPVLADHPGACLWIINASPEVDYQKSAEVKVIFYREQDTQTLTRQITIPPLGFTVINLDEDKELEVFFGGQVGWCTMASTAPYTTSIYLSRNPSGVVGGDHSF